jgi:hypothetical protein
VLSCAEDERSTHCQERNLLVVFIAGNACALPVEDRLAVHQEPISVVAVPELDLDKPPAIYTAAHGMRSRIPPIEIAHQINRLRRRGGTIEIDRLCHSSCRIRIGVALVKYSVHLWKVFSADVDCGFLKISSSSFVIVGFEKPAEGQICMPETPSQNPADKSENRQSIKNEENHKFLSFRMHRAASCFVCG